MSRRTLREAACRFCALAASALALQAALGTAAAADEPPAGIAYQVRIEAPAELKTLLETYLDLNRYRTDAANDLHATELARLTAAAPEQARALLRTEGYFEPEVSVSTEQAADGLRVTVKVEPGPRVRVRDVTITLADAGADDDSRQRAERRFRLRSGEPFRQAAWDDAKNQLLSALQEDRYPAARLVDSRAEIDVAQHAADLTVTVQRGAPHAFGALRVEGAERYPADVAARLWPRGVGDPYRLKDLLDYQEQLQRSGLFDAAVVEVERDDDATPGPQQLVVVPVVVKLREKPKQAILLSVGYSANNGQRAGVEHTHRAPFGWDWIAKNKLEFARDRKAWDTEWTSYPLENRYRNLVSANIERLTSGGAPTRNESLRIGRSQEGERIDRLYYAEVQRSVVEAATGDIVGTAVSGNYQWVWRNINNVQFPTRGVTVQAQAGAGIRYGGENDKQPFTRLYGRFTFYQPLGNRWFGQARLEAGRVIANSAAGIPDALLFRAGGDDSIRGYAYRSLGADQAGTVVGGRVLLTGSVELARTVTPGWLAAAFIDAGDASDTAADWKARVGYGVGARWRSPVGPLKIDLAYAQQLRRVRLHVSVGVVF
jgi:translocation and assembly module TamA